MKKKKKPAASQEADNRSAEERRIDEGMEADESRTVDLGDGIDLDDDDEEGDESAEDRTLEGELIYARVHSAGQNCCRIKTKDGGEEELDVDDDCNVLVNGTPTTLDDLKRGDRITAVGGPVHEIRAVR